MLGESTRDKNYTAYLFLRGFGTENGYQLDIISKRKAY